MVTTILKEFFTLYGKYNFPKDKCNQRLPLRRPKEGASAERAMDGYSFGALKLGASRVF